MKRTKYGCLSTKKAAAAAAAVLCDVAGVKHPFSKSIVWYTIKHH
jgi:hypothetical protein